MHFEQDRHPGVKHLSEVRLLQGLQAEEGDSYKESKGVFFGRKAEIDSGFEDSQFCLSRARYSLSQFQGSIPC